MPTWAIIVITAAVTYLVGLIVRQVRGREKKIKHELEHLYAIADPQFALSMEGLLPPAILAGNIVTALINGREIFPSMLAAIRSAQKSINFETYIYWSGRIGQDFAEALIERARAGVAVNVVVDWFGSNKLDADAIKSMQGAGIDIQRYHPIRWYDLDRINNRTHRKLLIVDGRVGFTGGAGIADHWDGNAEDADHWRDSHFKIEGPTVRQLQTAFMDNWMKVRQRVLHSADYFPKLEPVGSVRAQLFMSSPQEGSESMRLMYLLSITSAAETIRLASAYFVPDDMSVQELVKAKQRGVKIEVIVPGPLTDVGIVRRAGRARWGPLLAAGIEIYEYQPTMYHCKVLVVDDLWVSVGSTNFDNRSFRLNDEANLNVLDRDFALSQVRQFEADKQRSRRITLAEWQRRPWTEKLKERTAALLRAQL